MKSKGYMRSKGYVSIQDVITDFDALVREEQEVDRLFSHREERAAAILYLRGMQSGELAFPAPKFTAPSPQVLLSALSNLHPEAVLDIEDPVFASIYRRTRDFAAARSEQEGSVWIYEVIGEFRRLIIEQ